MSDNVHIDVTKEKPAAAAQSPMKVDGRFLRKLVLCCFCAALLAPLAIPIDVAVARWWRSDPLPGDFTRAIELTEVFAHGIGVAYLLLGLLILVPRVRGYLPRIAALAYGAGAVATIVKVFVIRARPHSLVRLDLLASESGWNLQFDPTLDRIAVFDTMWRSFPSGHTATAVGMVVGMTLLFPRGRHYFALIASLAILQRISSNAHYVSDVLVGLSVGFGWSYICLHPNLLGTLLRQMEPEESKPLDCVAAGVPALAAVDREPQIESDPIPQRKAA